MTIIVNLGNQLRFPFKGVLVHDMLALGEAI